MLYAVSCYIGSCYYGIVFLFYLESLEDWVHVIDGHIDGLVQDYSISIALAMEILQSCTKPLIYWKETASVSI